MNANKTLPRLHTRSRVAADHRCAVRQRPHGLARRSVDVERCAAVRVEVRGVGVLQLLLARLRVRLRFDCCLCSFGSLFSVSTNGIVSGESSSGVACSDATHCLKKNAASAASIAAASAAAAFSAAAFSSSAFAAAASSLVIVLVRLMETAPSCDGTWALAANQGALEGQ